VELKDYDPIVMDEEDIEDARNAVDLEDDDDGEAL
jgi:hypothetical protein